MMLMWKSKRLIFFRDTSRPEKISIKSVQMSVRAILLSVKIYLKKKRIKLNYYFDEWIKGTTGTINECGHILLSIQDLQLKNIHFCSAVALRLTRKNSKQFCKLFPKFFLVLSRKCQTKRDFRIGGFRLHRKKKNQATTHRKTLLVVRTNSRTSRTDLIFWLILNHRLLKLCWNRDFPHRHWNDWIQQVRQTYFIRLF